AGARRALERNLVLGVRDLFGLGRRALAPLVDRRRARVPPREELGVRALRRRRARRRRLVRRRIPDPELRRARGPLRGLERLVIEEVVAVLVEVRAPADLDEQELVVRAVGQQHVTEEPAVDVALLDAS